MALTVVEVKQAEAKGKGKAYKLSDGGGLYLFVSTAGAKSWRFKYRFNKKEKLLTFGLFPEVSLAQARAKRDEARAAIRDGRDPAGEARQDRIALADAEAATFRSIANQWYEDSRPTWSASHQERVRHRLERDLYPAFGDVPIGDVTAHMVLRALRVLTGQFALLFPTNRNWREPISDMALSKLYKTMVGGKDQGRMVPHGWRNAFSTIMNERAAMREADNDRLLIDMMLSHVPTGMSASEWAYNRARYLKPRRRLAQEWADLISAGLPSPWDYVIKP